MAVSIAYAIDMIVNHSRYKDSEKWKKKVDSMPSWQVMAIYYRMLHNGEFDQKKKEDKRVELGYTQPTLFDFGLEIEE